MRPKRPLAAASAPVETPPPPVEIAVVVAIPVEAPPVEAPPMEAPPMEAPPVAMTPPPEVLEGGPEVAAQVYAAAVDAAATPPAPTRRYGLRWLPPKES